MKTTFYVAFGLTNTTTRNFLVGIFSTDDENLLKIFRDEQLSTNDQPTLRTYIFSHPQSYSSVPYFVDSLNYFAEGNFDARLLGVYLEENEAKSRIQYSLDSFRSNRHGVQYMNECYNLSDSIENEEQEKKRISGLSTSIKESNEKYEKEGKNNKSDVKKQSITIVEIESGEEHHFDTKGECMKFLGCATDTFSRFLKGKTKLNKKYSIKEDSQTECSLT